jgi:hypothetical protein
VPIAVRLSDKARLVERRPASCCNDALPVAVRVTLVEDLVNLKDVLAVVVAHHVSALGADLAPVVLVVVDVVAGAADVAAGINVALAEAGDDQPAVIAVIVSLLLC